MALMDKFAGEGPDSFPTQRAAFRNVLADPENNMYQHVIFTVQGVGQQNMETS